MPDTMNQTPPAIEKVPAAGLSDVAGSRTAAPMPTPSRFRRNWMASASATPAKIAPHDTLWKADVAEALS